MCCGNNRHSAAHSHGGGSSSSSVPTTVIVAWSSVFITCCLGNDVRLAKGSSSQGLGGNDVVALAGGLGSRILEESDEGSGFSWERFLILTGCCIVIIGVSIFGVALPSLFKKCARKEESFCGRHGPMVETCCNAFAAGAFWGLAFFHVLCEGTDMLDQADVGLYIGSSFYNLVYVLIFIGYLFIYSCDRILTVISAKSKQKYQRALSTIPIVDSFVQQNECTPNTQVKKLTERQAILQGACATIGLSIHSFFEGMVIGMRDSDLLILVATVSVVGHKWAASFALTQKLSNAGLTRGWIIAFLSVFILSTPIGIYVGMPFGMMSDSAIVGVFNGLSVGILVFVASDATRDICTPTHWRKAVSSEPNSSLSCPNKGASEGKVQLSHSCLVCEPQGRRTSTSAYSSIQDETSVDVNESARSKTTKDEQEDLLAASWIAVLARITFMTSGAALIFGMMVIHLSDPGHSHSHSTH